MNETYYVKINGKANIPERLEIGHNFKLTSDCSVTQEQKVDNNDGSFDVIFKLEPVTVSIEQDNGKTVKAKDPRKNSQKVRNTLYREWSFLNVPIDFDTFYDACTNIIIKNAVAIADEALGVIHIDTNSK